MTKESEPIKGKLSFKYDAFISYSHAVDGKLAPALRQGLHRFIKPLFKLRALNVFRDQASLAANPGLWTSIENALSESGHFLLLASPEAAASPWVNKEVEWWIKNRSSDTMVIVVTDGTVAWDGRTADFDWAKTTALPPSLRGAFREEPRWINLGWAREEADVSLNNPRFRDAVADLAAKLHNRDKDELIGEDVELLRRARLARRGVVIALSSLVVAFAAAAYFANVKRIEATARALAATAALEMQLPNSRERSMLLALEAAKRKMSVDLRQTIWKGIALLPVYVQILPVDFLRKDGSASGYFAFDQDEKFLATENGRGLIQLWDLNDGSEIAQWKPDLSGEGGVSGRSRRMQLAPQAECLIYFTDPPLIWYPWDKARSRVMTPAKAQGEQVLVSANGDFVAIVKMGSVDIWDSCMRQLNATININDNNHEMILSWDGRYLATSNSGEIKVWRTSNGSPIGQYSHDELKSVDLIRFSVNSTNVAALETSTVHIFPLASPGMHQAIKLEPTANSIFDYQIRMPGFGVSYTESYDGICELRTTTKQGSDVSIGEGGQLEVCDISLDGNSGAYNPETDLYLQRLTYPGAWSTVIPNVPEEYSHFVSSLFGMWGPTGSRLGVVKRSDRLLVLQLPYTDIRTRHGDQQRDRDNMLHHESEYTMQQLVDMYGFEVKDEKGAVLPWDSNPYLNAVGSSIRISSSGNGRYISVPIGLDKVAIHDTIAKRGIATVRIKEFYRPPGYVIPALTSSVSNDGQYVAVAREDMALVKIVKVPTTELVARVTPSMLGLRGDEWEVPVRFGFSEDSDAFLLEMDDTLFAFPLDMGGILKEGCRRVQQNLTREDWKLFVGAVFYKKTCPGLPVGIVTGGWLWSGQDR